jgi:hypothetical protein
MDLRRTIANAFSQPEPWERINAWEEGKRLAFTVVSGPEGMSEWCLL